MAKQASPKNQPAASAHFVARLALATSHASTPAITKHWATVSGTESLANQICGNETAVSATVIQAAWDAAQAPRHAPQADQAKDREEGRDEEGQLRRAERVPQGGQDRKQRGKAGSDRRFGGVGNQEAAREARKLARHVLRNPIPEQRRAAVRRQRAQQRIVELKRAVAGDLPAEVQVDGGVAGLHRGFVRREDQYGAQQNPRGRRQPGAAHVDQQAESPPHDDEEDRD